MGQSVKSEIKIATSTPNEEIAGLSKKYGIPVYVNEGDHGITQDWNFALSLVSTKYATIAHQDDVYEKEYTEVMLRIVKLSKKPLICFTDYGEIREGVKTERTALLRIKRMMLFPLRNKRMWSSRFARRAALAFGNPVCCPSVMYALNNLERPVFRNYFRCNEDWEAWEKLSRFEGDFVYLPKILMYHRIHGESTTTEVIENGKRITEDYEMFRKFWPKQVAGFLCEIYKRSERFNQLTGNDKT